MLDKLLIIQKRSFVILSNYPVAAILIMENGDEIAGINIESNIPSTSICAERNAIFSAMSLGYKLSEFREIHIIGGNDPNYIITPCGVCRQLIFDFIPNVSIYTYNKKNKIIKSNILNLLPSGFIKEN